MKPHGLNQKENIQSAATAREREQAIDPVCGMSVNKETAAGSLEHGGQTYFFCSTDCMEIFRKDPSRFLKDSTAQVAGEPKQSAAAKAEYTCPMHPEIREAQPGSCPKCGMPLEPVHPPVPTQKIEYTCPMHPQIVRDKPGNCPICGMALEPRTISFEDEKNPELVDMTRRFWVSVALSIPLLVIAMSEFVPGNFLERIVSMRALGWIQFILATPVVVWGGWPFYVRAWQSVVNRSLNMFTLIGLGVAVSYIFSVIAKLFPEIFPPSFRDPSGAVPVYFEAAAVITTLVLLGQVLELRARSQTGAAIKALLGLAPRTARRVS